METKLKHPKRLTFVVFFALTLILVEAWCIFPPSIRAEPLDMKCFSSISFYIALCIFPVIYLIVNVQKLKWLGIIISFFDITIALYLVMWTHGSVYWSPFVISFFHVILMKTFLKEGNTFFERYEECWAEWIVSVYYCAGIGSICLWILFRFF